MMGRVGNFCSCPGFHSICEYLEVDEKRIFKLIWNKLFIINQIISQKKQSI